MLWFSAGEDFSVHLWWIWFLTSLCTSLAKTAEGLCSLLSPSVVQWDAMTVFMECMVAQIFKNLEEEVTGAISSNRTKLFWKIRFDHNDVKVCPHLLPLTV